MFIPLRIVTISILTAAVVVVRGLKVIVDKEDMEDSGVLMAFFSSDYYHTQNMSIFNVIKTKLKKIWYIIRNKDYCYSEILLTGKEFDEFRNHLNKIN